VLQRRIAPCRVSVQRLLKCVAECVLQYVAVCSRECVAVSHSSVKSRSSGVDVEVCCSVLRGEGCSVLQCVAVCVLQCGVVLNRVGILGLLQGVAECVLQYVAVCVLLSRVDIKCKILQHTQCTTVQHSATQCNTLQHA